jgi:hypothetical protein
LVQMRGEYGTWCCWILVGPSCEHGFYLNQVHTKKQVSFNWYSQGRLEAGTILELEHIRTSLNIAVVAAIRNAPDYARIPGSKPSRRVIYLGAS